MDYGVILSKAPATIIKPFLLLQIFTPLVSEGLLSFIGKTFVATQQSVVMTPEAAGAPGETNAINHQSVWFTETRVWSRRPRGGGLTTTSSRLWGAGVLSRLFYRQRYFPDHSNFTLVRISRIDGGPSPADSNLVQRESINMKDIFLYNKYRGNWFESSGAPDATRTVGADTSVFTSFSGFEGFIKLRGN